MDARDKLGIPWQHSENEKHGMFLMGFENKAGLPVEPATFQLYVPALSALWGDSGIQEAFRRRSEFQLVSEPAPGPWVLRTLKSDLWGDVLGNPVKVQASGSCRKP